MATPPVELAPEPAARRVAEPRPPQMRTPDPAPASGRTRSRWWLWLGIVAVGIAGWYYRAEWLPQVTALLSHSAPAKSGRPPQRPVTVGTATVRQRPVNSYLNGLGTVTAFKTVTVRSRVEGELVKIAFQEGQTVKEGDLLAEIDPRVWQAQLEQAEGQLARDEATLKAARQTFARLQMLLQQKIITTQEVDDQTALVQQAEAAVKTDRALIANAQLQLEFCTITSPITGRIGLRLVDRGNMVRANDVGGLAVITQLQPIALLFTIPQDDISRVLKRSNGQDTLAVDAFDRDFRTKLASGKLLAVDNQVDATTGTVRLKAVFDNTDEMLFPNQFVNARLLVDSNPEAIVVPSAAVQRGDTFHYVYVVEPDETVSLREVTPGSIDGTETVIEAGLQPGETVVTEGLDRLTAGAKITLKDKAGAGGPPAGTRPATDKPAAEKPGLEKTDPEKAGQPARAKEAT